MIMREDSAAATLPPVPLMLGIAAACVVSVLLVWLVGEQSMVALAYGGALVAGQFSSTTTLGSASFTADGNCAGSDLQIGTSRLQPPPPHPHPAAVASSPVKVQGKWAGGKWQGSGREVAGDSGSGSQDFSRGSRVL